MNLHTQGAPDDAIASDSAAGFKTFDDLSPSTLSPLDPTDSFNLHKAINERRAQVENAALLKHLRSL
ncbi:MAG: hypothetical protein U1C74_00020 [Phenylobacterium sp.]|nr:hypothetical protein [Phenylobacterium sp.]